mgnify:FL=1
MAMKPRRFSEGGSVVNLGAGAVPARSYSKALNDTFTRASPPSGSDTTVGDPKFGADVDAQNEKNKKDMPPPPPARKKPAQKMRGGGMVKKKPVQKMRGGGMVKKMRGGGMVKKK